MHRTGDKPAVILYSGEKRWYINGELHRVTDNPAVIKADGDQIWYKYNRMHRDGDLPAIVKSNGEQYCCRNGVIMWDPSHLLEEY